MLLDVHVHAEYRGLESHPRQLIFLWKSDHLRGIVLLYFICVALLASFFLPSASLINMYCTACVPSSLLFLPPLPPPSMVMHTVFTPISLRDDVVRLRDNLLSAMDRLDPASLHGFITAYGFLCDFFSVPFNEEVTWVSRYLSHSTWVS